jgi:hypothetical protein
VTLEPLTQLTNMHVDRLSRHLVDSVLVDVVVLQQPRQQERFDGRQTEK